MKFINLFTKDIVLVLNTSYLHKLIEQLLGSQQIRNYMQFFWKLSMDQILHY